MLELIMECALWNTNARVVRSVGSRLLFANQNNFEINYANATDKGLISHVMDLTSGERCFEKQNALAGVDRLCEVPFDS